MSEKPLTDKKVIRYLEKRILNIGNTPQDKDFLKVFEALHMLALENIPQLEDIKFKFEHRQPHERLMSVIQAFLKSNS